MKFVFDGDADLFLGFISIIELIGMNIVVKMYN